MNHTCHWTEVENIFMPREATIVRVAQPTPQERHFTLKMADGKGMKFEPGQIVELSMFGFGEIPIGFASSPTRENTFDLVTEPVPEIGPGEALVHVTWISIDPTNRTWIGEEPTYLVRCLLTRCSMKRDSWMTVL